MTDKDKIRSVVARFFNVSEATVTEDFPFPLERLNASIGRATFHAAIKRMAGADLPSAFTAKTFRELLGLVVAPVSAGASATVAPAVPASVSLMKNLPMSGAGVGIDIESLDELPVAADFWSEPFYVENFTPVEIAYCQRQADPRTSFCGLWCAKEAARKCSPEFFGLHPLDLEILHDVQGRPFLAILRDKRRLGIPNCDLSISHTHSMGAAVCVMREILATTPGVAPVVSQGAQDSSGRILAWLGLALGLLNLLFWLFFTAKK
ncbi:MAG TPA: 4'-phosphopantetheinyl transferase superfamily protein [Verrucomicrobiae bacterium]|nr:4'-phosphopantetheinyl transferase superfamily protein [Verrucomicrobiae bacterium]